MRSSVFKTAVLSALLLLLVSCQSNSGFPTFYGYRPPDQPAQSPALKSSPGPDQEVLRVGEEVYYNLTVLHPPAELRPVGMADTSRGYFSDREQFQVLWLFDFDSKVRHPVVDYRGSDSRLASEIVFNDRWLVWQEVSPGKNPSTGIRPYRECRLWLRDLSSLTDNNTDILLATSDILNLYGFFLPFDSLSLDDHYLVFRHSDYSTGPRITSVILVDLLNLDTQTLAIVSEENGRRINRCSIADSLVVWDVCLGYRVNLPGLPPRLGARYNLFTYQLDTSKLGSRDEALKQITLNRAYSSPFAWQGKFLAVVENVRTAYDYFSLSDIILIEPTPDDDRITFLTTADLSSSADFSFYLTDYYFANRYDDGFYATKNYWRYQPVAGNRFASWGSNLPEHHVVFDLEAMCFVALPVYFSDTYDDVIIMRKYTEIIEVLASGDVMVTGYDLQEIPWWPNLQNIRVTQIPGPSADYFYFEHIYDLEEPYILVVGG